MPFEYSDFLINPYIMVPPSFQPSERVVVGVLGALGYNSQADAERVSIAVAAVAVTED